KLAEVPFTISENPVHLAEISTSTGRSFEPSILSTNDTTAARLPRRPSPHRFALTSGFCFNFSGFRFNFGISLLLMLVQATVLSV
ncbi:hypothetical protein, partial [Sporolactobacillus inulinus]|uniref:hypothetical protein n=1 Tax=Sporolactobacillus inulinus TaxID=2078 RepID=UPI001C3FC762